MDTLELIKTTESSRNIYIIHGWEKTIRQALSTCDSCQRNKIPTTASSVILESVQPEKPLELLSVDFVEPLVKAKYGYE